VSLFLAREPATAIADAGIGLATALARIAARAGDFDTHPRFPREDFMDLAAAGIPQLAPDRGRCGLAREIEIVRAVAGASAATARILDGHFNGVERLALWAQEPLRARELERVASGSLLLGVWGADPLPGEGEPARVVSAADGTMTLEGVKTFCSGAGGVGRALVSARDGSGARRLAYVDVSEHVVVDRSWYRASGLRASESHRVEFHATTVLALLGEADELTREPWLARDGVRTAATWAGIADEIAAAAAAALADRIPDDARRLALGEMAVARASIDRWLDHAAATLSDAERFRSDAERQAAHTLAAQCRIAIARAAAQVSAEAARACGSRALVGGGTLDRARRDLDLFVLQHRLDPALTELGAAALEGAEALDPAARFERLFAASPDPWGYDSSAYESEKYAATLAALPPRVLGATLELACANGAFTALLAERCESVLAVDFSRHALEHAATRGLPANVELRAARIPDETPSGDWDLIVCSEILYYLKPEELLRTVRWLASQLELGACVLAVSWRGHGRDEPMLGDDVHDLLAVELRRWHTLDDRRPGFRLDRFDGSTCVQTAS
jgi:hypothetical protein